MQRVAKSVTAATEGCGNLLADSGFQAKKEAAESGLFSPKS
jgi:hypothetical protein